MTALLVLLAILSLATLASRRGGFARFFDRAATPLLVIAAVVLSPSGLATLGRGLVHDLQPALAVFVTWLGLLVGLDSTTTSPIAQTRSAMGRVILIGAVVASVVLSGLALLVPALLGEPAPVAPSSLLAAALVVGGSLVASPDSAGRVFVGEFTAGLCAVVAVFCWFAPVDRAALLGASQTLAILLAAGALLALLQRLTGGGADGDAVSRTVAVIGLVTLASGLLHNAGLPSALGGFIAGALLGRTPLGATLRTSLRPTARPVRIVVVFVIALGLAWCRALIVVGLLLAAAQLGLQLALTAAVKPSGRRRSLAVLAAGLTSSSTPLVLLSSFALARLPGADALLVAVTVAVVVTDGVAAALTLVSSSEATNEPTPQETT